MIDREHVLIVNPWAREYLCGDRPLSKTEGPLLDQEATFEIKRGRNPKSRHFITVNFNWDPELEETMCAQCHLMLALAQGNGIPFTMPNLKTQIKKIIRENSK